MVDLTSNNIRNYSIYKWAKPSNPKVENARMGFLNKQKQGKNMPSSDYKTHFKYTSAMREGKWVGKDISFNIKSGCPVEE